jgi:hypothetical protein
VCRRFESCRGRQRTCWSKAVSSQQPTAGGSIRRPLSIPSVHPRCPSTVSIHGLPGPSGGRSPPHVAARARGRAAPERRAELVAPHRHRRRCAADGRLSGAGVDTARRPRDDEQRRSRPPAAVRQGASPHRSRLRSTSSTNFSGSNLVESRARRGGGEMRPPSAGTQRERPGHRASISSSSSGARPEAKPNRRRTSCPTGSPNESFVGARTTSRRSESRTPVLGSTGVGWGAPVRARPRSAATAKP